MCALTGALEAVGVNPRSAARVIRDARGDRHDVEIGGELAHAGLEGRGELQALLTCDSSLRWVEGVEIDVGAPEIALGLGQAAEGVGFEQPGHGERVGGEALHGLRSKIVGAHGRVPTVHEELDRQATAGALLDLLELAVPILDVDASGLRDGDPRFVCAELFRESGRGVSALQEGVCGLHSALTPPTVMAETRTVGMPRETGTLWPSLPQVQPPSAKAKSSPTRSTRSRH